MVARASGIDSVYVRVTGAGGLPRRPERPTSRGDDDLRRTPYLAWVYSKLSLPIDRPFEPPPDQPMEWAGEPFAGVETFVVNWARYSEYQSSYFEGGKDAFMMQERLFETLPRGLQAILSGEFGGGRTRTWFHSDAPEVNQLPWELVAYANGSRLSSGGSFVRGIPPETATPLVPVVDRLRLGLIDPRDRAAPAFRAALKDIEGQVEVVPLSGGIADGLHAAAEQGVELLHVVADASVTPSYDGVLETPEGHPVASSEVAGILRGSRVRLVSLTPPAEDPSSSRTGAYVAPSTYRAFTYFATSPYPIPTFIVPVGPMDDRQVHDFWTTFYGALAGSLEMEAALTEALHQRVVPIGLFLRQLQPAAFRRVSEIEQPKVDPSVVGAQLQASQELLRQIEQVSSQLNFRSPSLNKLMKKEERRHSQLQADVSQWIEGVHEE